MIKRELKSKKQPSSFRLCGLCLKREYSARKQRRASRAVKPSDCEICQGELSKLPKLADEIIRELHDYEFDTFQVGTIVPQRFLDREDELRSTFKIRGKENLKSQITRTIASKVAKATGRKIDYSKPEMIVLISLADHSITLSPKSLWIEGRYQKNERGVPQKSKQCSVCGGIGCANCEFKGFDRASIQSIIGNFLTETFLAQSCNFIWIGSEDENSLVNGEGRPFYAEIVRPKKRQSGLAKLTRRKGTSSMVKKILHSVVLGHGVSFITSGALRAKPSIIPQFKLDCEVHLVLAPSNKDIVLVDAQKIESTFSHSEIIVDVPRKFKKVKKIIDSVSVRQSTVGITLLIRCDGGIPIRRLVSAEDGSVSPNLRQFIEGYAIDDSKPFDVLNVELVEGLRVTPSREASTINDLDESQYSEANSALIDSA